MQLFTRRTPLPRVRRSEPARAIERGLGVIALLAALLLLGAAIVVRNVVTDMIEAGHSAGHAYQTKLELENLATSMARAEASVRAYVTLGRNRSLEPYQAAHTEASLSLEALRHLNSNTQFQSTDIALLDSLVRQRFAALSKAIDAREESGADAARVLLDTDEVHLTTTRIETLLQTMQEREEQDLKASLEKQSNSNQFALTLMVSTMVLLAVIAIAFWGTLKREFLLRRRLEQRLSDTVIEDDLTGAINRPAFERLLDQEWAFRLRYATPLSLLLLEIDNLGDVNARFGLDAGDALLRDVSRRLRGRLRTTERLARYGGQQFALLVPQSLNDAAALSRQLSELIVAAPYPMLDHSGETRGTIEVEVSIGLADASDVDSASYLVLGAGEALYAAKQQTEVPRIALYRPGMREAAAEAALPKRKRPARL